MKVQLRTTFNCSHKHLLWSISIILLWIHNVETPIWRSHAAATTIPNMYMSIDRLKVFLVGRAKLSYKYWIIYTCLLQNRVTGFRIGQKYRSNDHAYCFVTYLRYHNITAWTFHAVKYTESDVHFIIILVHDTDVIMGTMTSEITSPMIVYSSVYSGADQR